MIEIKTERLKIVPMTEDEMLAIIQQYQSTDPEMGTAYQEMLDHCIQYPEQYLWYTAWKICLRDSGARVGDADFKGFNHGYPEIGYGIDAEYRKHGYATEAVRGLCGWAFQIPKVEAVEAETDADNVKSQNVLTKNGFVKTGEMGEEGPRFRLERPGVCLKHEAYDQVAKNLFEELHHCPEISGQEKETKDILVKFLSSHTSLEICSWDGGFYAVHHEDSCTDQPIALRADYDALELPEGGAAHLCGHDGHAAALCLTALELEGRKVGRDVYLLFQSAEETGVGALKCLDFIEKEHISEIYGAHNLPGFPFGQVYTRFGTFACGSLGLTISYHGKATHAAYPEHGKSPAQAVGEMLSSIPQLSASDRFSSMTLCTVIGVSMGEKAFGAAAADAEIWLTLRAEEEVNLMELKRSVLNLAQNLAEKYQLEFDVQEQDTFPATENHKESVQKVVERCSAKLQEEPMRWSEDFGHYLQHCRGAFLGIGAGEDHAALHTENYEYPVELLRCTADMFLKLLRE